MADFVTLTCPSCGGKLQITPDIDRFACTHCGNEHLVKRGEGIIALQPLTESLAGLKRATDRTASEMAIRRLSNEQAQLQAARQQAEGRAAAHRKVIAAHDQYKLSCQTALFGIVATPICVLLYMATDESPEGSFLAMVSGFLMLSAAIFALMAGWFFLKWLLTSEPTPARKVAQENLRATEAELAGLAQEVARRDEEIGQHKRVAALSE